MPIPALKFTTNPAGSEPVRSELPAEQSQDLEQLRSDSLPVLYLLRNCKDLDVLRQFRDVIEDSTLAILDHAKQ